MKEIKGKYRKWKIVYAQMGRINIIKNALLLKLLQKFNAIVIQIPKALFKDLE